jgi:hypothetical protein
MRQLRLGCIDRQHRHVVRFLLVQCVLRFVDDVGNARALATGRCKLVSKEKDSIQFLAADLDIRLGAMNCSTSRLLMGDAVADT